MNQLLINFSVPMCIGVEPWPPAVEQLKGCAANVEERFAGQYGRRRHITFNKILNGDDCHGGGAELQAS